MNIKNVLPINLIKLVRKFNSFRNHYFYNREIKKIRNSQIQIVKELRKKEVLNVIFFVIHDSIWKYEEVYNLLDNNPMFNVNVAVIPLVRKGKGEMNVYAKTLKYFEDNNYKVVKSFDYENNRWLDIKASIKPDIVFFTNPHNLTFDDYYIDNFTDILTCYVPYAFVVIHDLKLHYNLKFHHFLWRYFVETESHKDFSKIYLKTEKSNVYVTGFSGLDRIKSTSYYSKEVWKNYSEGSNIFKIIWAPHHTIAGQGGGLDYSSFMEYSEYFIRLLETNKNIQVAFKPHPLLKEKLYNYEHWGKEKTDSYYIKWESLPNGQLEEGGYIDLFYSSDAMIMDSASFIVEYLYFDKPILFTKKDNKVLDRFNSFGQEVFKYLYQANNKSDVNKFIENTVLNNQDYLKENRNQFLNNVILPKNGKTASENIYNELLRELC